MLNNKLQLFRERLSEKSVECTRQSRKVVRVIISILFISIQNHSVCDLATKNEDLRFREMWMKEFLGSYSIVLAVAALHMSPKTIQHCVLKCLSTVEVKACTKFRKTKNSSLCIHTISLRRQTYFRLSLLSTKTNVCESELGTRFP